MEIRVIAANLRIGQVGIKMDKGATNSFFKIVDAVEQLFHINIRQRFPDKSAPVQAGDVELAGKNFVVLRVGLVVEKYQMMEGY